MKFQAIPPRLRFVDNNGNALVGGKLYTYSAGTTTPLATYTDSTGGSANANPIILDSRGEADIWLSDSVYYKFVTKDSADNIIDTTDNISNAIYGTLSATSGATSVGFIHYGASATSRTVADKEKDIVSLFDYGTFDDADKTDIRTRALTRQVGAKIAASALLINALGAAAWCPAGSYNINDGVSITTAVGLTLLGAGAFSNNTLWKKTSNGDAVTLTSQTRCVFRGITLQGTGMSTGNGLVLDGNGSGVILIEDCQFAYFPGRGIYANFPSGSPASGVDYIRNLVLECGATLGVPNAEFRYSNDSRWMGNQYGGKVGGPYATIGAYHYECKASNFGPGNFYWEHTVGAKYENCDYGRFIGERWEENQHENVAFVNMVKFNVTGCHIHTGSKASSGTYDGMTMDSCALASVAGGNEFYSFNATDMRYCINIANTCNSLQIADNVFSAFTTRPVNWDRTTFAIHLAGNLPTGYAINQIFPAFNAKYIGIAAGQTRYAGVGEGSATEADVLALVDTPIMATRIIISASALPGAGQTYVVTLRKGGVDTAHTATITNAAFTGLQILAVGSEISFASPDQYSWKIVASAGAATATIRIAQSWAV